MGTVVIFDQDQMTVLEDISKTAYLQMKKRRKSVPTSPLHTSYGGKTSALNTGINDIRHISQ
ncbi:hypothetical protein KQR56_14495 [Bacillus velezensis]|nr:hypothetical protein [Bacillus velezensis]